MDKLELFNILGEVERTNRGKTFEVASPFYPDYVTSVQDTGIFEIKSAISKSRNSAAVCNRLSFEQKKDILKNAAKALKFSAEDFEYVVKMTGMPLKSVGKYVSEIPHTLAGVPDSIENRIGVKYGKIARHPIAGSDMFKFLEPIDGFVYAVTPGNDPRVVSLVVSWLVTLGIPGVLKVSKNDMLISKKVVRAVLDSGYPPGGLNLLCWDTSKPGARKLNFDLVDASTAVWAFGDSVTVDNILRFEEVGGGHKIDHFSDKIVLRHGSGRAAAICDESINRGNAAGIITESALNWPIGCNSLKAVFDANDKHEELLGILHERFRKMVVGDPMDKKTDVGYANPKTLEYVFNKISQLKMIGLVDQRCGELLSDVQSTPILLNTKDKYSNFLSKEYPVYILAVKECASFNEAVDEVNESAGNSKRISVSVFSEEEEKVLRTFLKAHHIKRFRPTTELDALFCHEGNDYLHKLTIPQVHRVGAAK